MKKIILILSLLFGGSVAFGQKVDSIFFHLYTDSLKKGQYNYINVDGKLSNGTWRPLTSKEIEFSCSSASFEGNQLIIPEDFKADKVTVKAVLKANPSVMIQRTIWIKQLPDPPLPGRNDIAPESKQKRKRNR